MIPLQLNLSGFLSYRDPIELDFTQFDLACIAGPNGAGKSSLLDAITWALFGQARKRDDSLLNNHPEVKAAQVSFTFAYEGNVYRVQRVLPRGKTTLLEFHILQDSQHAQDDLSDGPPSRPTWKPLTERTLKETQERLQSILRLDYETFVNASFFLQGKADQFTQQRPADRKRLLSSILGLEVWEAYRHQTAEMRKTIEAEITSLEGRLAEVIAELDEEEQRRAHLKALEGELKRKRKSVEAQSTLLESLKREASRLEEERRRVGEMGLRVETAAGRLQELDGRLSSRKEERQSHALMLSQAGQIEAAYTAWKQAREELEHWDQVAASYRQQEKRRQEPLGLIQAEHARLSQELETLSRQRVELEASCAQVPGLQERLAATHGELVLAEEQIALRQQLEAERSDALQRKAEAGSENPRLKADMDQLKARIAQLESSQGAVCPVCGQPLNPQDRQRLIEELTSQGLEMGRRYRANRELLASIEAQVGEFARRIAELAAADEQRLAHLKAIEQFNLHLEQIRTLQAGWERDGALRMAAIQAALQDGTYAIEARIRLAEIDADLKALGYDAQAHDLVRQAEAQGREAEEALRNLEKARSAIAPLDREIEALKQDISRQQDELSRLQREYEQAAAALAAAEVQAPDLPAAERALLDLKEQENRLLLDVGAARQKVEVLADLKVRRQNLSAQREERAQQAAMYKQLERAFGKDGVPALLIEQALPQIESRANEILDRLSAGGMAVRFITQAAYKDKHRDDLKETLDIQISDSAGTRDYELFSGGEAFRVNFAIRLALAEVLAQRAGARLQTLVIDEGFGSQDEQGRQRLIEAINLVREDFAKILVITHIDELKDAFPTRIEVEKTERGSLIRVV